MGLLSEGTPLNWPETQANADLIRIQGIQEFIKIYQRYKTNRQDEFKWGDEIEFSLVKFDHEKKRVYLLLKAQELIDKLNLKKAELRDKENITYHPEYASYMIESTPGMPFTNDLNASFRCLEANMRSRRDQVERLLDRDEHILAITVFPRIGCTTFTWPLLSPTPECGITRSLFYPDQAIYNGHPRFVTISSNIRNRRNSKVQIYLPIFKDTNTQCPFVEQLDENFIADHIYLDATGFGMGCCCLQCTFQAESMDEARFLYDQLTPITPIMLALSASSPIWRGYLSNIDCRWNTISGSVDDRTDEELGKLPLKNNR
jgi:glutamate--cysteine ligase catalytic subunit